MFADLSRFFAPRAAAFIGATEDQAKFGGRCVRRLIDFGFEGVFFPINPRRETIFGHTCFPSIREVPQTPDHVGIVLAAPMVPGALEACADAGVPFATVFSSGFAETGTEEGRALERRIADIARAGGIRVMGPNCNGMVSFVDRFALTSTAAVGANPPPAGDIAVASQSGGAGQVNIMWRALEAGLGVSYQVSCGNCADLDLIDYMAFMVEDPKTRVVLALAEHLEDGHKLAALAHRAAELDKPIVMVKVGRTEAGRRAAASHTGAVTGTDAVWDAALAQLGIIRVDDTTELIETAMMLRGGKRPGGRGLAATSISGGNLVMAAELGARLGIEWPRFGEETQARLRADLPGFVATENPADLTAMAVGQTGTFARVVDAIAADPAVDVVMPVLTISPAEEVRAVAAVAAGSAAPAPILWTGYASDDAELTPATLVRDGAVVFRDALPCLKAIHRAMVYAEARQRVTAPPPPRPGGIDAGAARALLANVSGPLSEAASKALLAHYGLPVTREAVARDASEAARAAAEIDEPVALKILSADIAHKTEAGAIRLGVTGDPAVREAFDAVMEAAWAYRPDARIEGVLVQEMVGEGVEMLAGVATDPTFGSVITVGLGGVLVEVIKDVAIRIPPLGIDEAEAAVRSLAGSALLDGVRGRPPADVAALADVVARLSSLAVDLGDRIAELDINPVTVLEQGRGVRIVDALVVAREVAS